MTLKLWYSFFSFFSPCNLKNNLVCIAVITSQIHTFEKKCFTTVQCYTLHINKMCEIWSSRTRVILFSFRNKKKTTKKKLNMYVCADGLEQPQHQIPHFHWVQQVGVCWLKAGNLIFFDHAGCLVMTPIKEKAGLVAETRKRFGLFFVFFPFCFSVLFWSPLHPPPSSLWPFCCGEACQGSAGVIQIGGNEG